MTHLAPLEIDALVIGAGPVGLFQVFQLGLQGVACHVIDTLHHVGGQCAELYGDKPIYDIPGIAVCTGRELAERLRQQTAPFAPVWHGGQQVQSLQRQGDGRWAVASSSGQQWLARCVFIAAGVGAFVPRRWTLDGLEQAEGTQVFVHGVAAPQLHTGAPTHPHPARSGPAWAGQQVVVAGEGDDALATALAACQAQAARVTLVHRRCQFSAQAELQARVRLACEQGLMHFVAGQPTGTRSAHGRLQAIELLTPEGHTQWLAVDVLHTCLGLSPKLGPLAQWGLAMSRKQLEVNPADFSTSEPGIFAVGDINTYPGKRKLIVCGFHEATLAAYAAVQLLRPDDKTPLQYTTTSRVLQQRLGVLAAGDKPTHAHG